jgi:hypothetical protein
VLAALVIGQDGIECLGHVIRAVCGEEVFLVTEPSWRKSGGMVGLWPSRLPAVVPGAFITDNATVGIRLVYCTRTSMRTCPAKSRGRRVRRNPHD